MSKDPRRSIFFSPLSGGSTSWRPCPSAASHFHRCLCCVSLCLWTLTAVLRIDLKLVFWKFILLTFTSFLSSFLWDLKCHYLGAILTEYSAGPFRASFFVLFVCVAWRAPPFPPSPACVYWLCCWCAELVPEVFCLFKNRLLSPLWNCPNKGRRARPVWIWEGNWCLPPPFPAPSLAGTDSWTRVHVLTSYQEVPGGAWGLAAPPLLLELGTHPQLAATCNPSCLLASWAQSTGARAHPLL